ncbi:NAD(P)H-hydrate epimerase [Schnuerera ultunensis]|uniref:NAD(P)H-hydrate epimerase n=1 Tax=Schnuerera ultunensis TaxID=45497 RepID=UPI000410E7DC|nr:NAD(P)H-hydrate epimerase [Schnuerera ultunensis]
MFTISCSEMKAMDSYAINSIGIPSIVLMENAALKVLKNIDLEKIDSFTLVCGVGNNGGDGLAIARHLVLANKAVDLFIIGNLDKRTKDFNINLNILNNLGIDFIHITKDEDLKKLKHSLNISELAIDSIFGIGLTREIEGLFRKTIDIINKYSKDIISVDIPSGLDGDTGQVLGISVKAKKTVTFHHMKKGLINSKEYAGDVIVEDIGIPDKATKMVLGIE